ncbi:MAG: CotH kinase family protein [Saprospiraceae bacterium]
MFKFQIKFVFLAFTLITYVNCFSQNLLPEAGEIFRDDIIPRIDILLPADSLDYILDDANAQSNYHFHATFIFDNGTIRDTLNDIGFRLRGNTSRTADKNSFKISFNTYAPGRNYYGLEKMNINGEHNDPSIIRSKLGWDMATQIGLPASRCNHVRLYVNNEYFGLFIHVEHVDEEFVDLRFGSKDGNLYKCLYPADLHYLGSDPDEYKLVVFGRQVYQLKTNTNENDYSKLAHFIDVLNNTPTDDLACELEQVFNVNQYLKYIVFDILTSNWDGPIFNKNNFYLYENPKNGLVEYIPYDIDNTFGIDWFNVDWANRNIYAWSPSSEYRPIYEKLMEVPEYKNRYTYYLRNIVMDIFNENNLNPHIDSLKSKMDPWRMDDPLAGLDYGYDFDDYENSFTQSLSGHVKYGIKEYILERYYAAISQWDQQNIEPIITQVENNFPNLNQDIAIMARVEDDNDLASVEVHYQFDGQPTIEIIEMFDDGLHNDEEANDGIYGVIIPPIGSGGELDYFVKVVDAIGLENRAPKCVNQTIFIGNSDLPLYVNEIMASNNNTFTDDAGEYDDWVEIYNGGADPIYLGDKYLSDNQNSPDKWQLPDLSIQPGEFLIFWADNDEVQGSNHTNFKLSAGGEFVGIFDAASNNFSMIDGYEFGEVETDQSLARLPNGTGTFQIAEPTPAASNMALEVDFFTKKLEVNVFPNPIHDVVNIVLENENNYSWNVEIIDQLGRVIFEENDLEGEYYTFSFLEKNWNVGIYFLKIEMENGESWSGKVSFF